MRDHEWVSKSGRPWSLRVRSDLCAKCGSTPDDHPTLLGWLRVMRDENATWMRYLNGAIDMLTPDDPTAL